ncbi:MAG: endo alpha-1,4 polygalactosaminidase [Acidobacteriia bacterium]|nr:endo alpha-1,4 polygalactosaminidase [Terriglobia bacterium]
MIGLRLLLALVIAPIFGFAAGSTPAPLRWVVCYSDKPRPEEFREYDLVVLDSQSHPPLARLKRPGRTLLAYLSLGEVSKERPYFMEAKREGILLGENPNWAGSYFVDLRSRLWLRRVLEQLVPPILASGFDGLFLDTLDDPVELERVDPAGHRGMTAAAVELVRGLRLSFPSSVLMMNRGYGLLPEVAPLIDCLLGESLYSTYDSGRRKYLRVSAADYRYQLSLLRQAKRTNPALNLFSLDYWDPGDPREIRRIYAVERANGLIPYVSTPALDRIVRER